MSNPFRITTLRADDPFCDRQEELAELVEHGRNGVGATLFSPRRYGKTSLILRAQQAIADGGGYTVYVDFYRVMSVEDLGGRLARAVYEGIHRRSSLLEKGRSAVMRFFRTYRPTFTPTPDGGVQIDARPLAGVDGYELLDSLLGEIGEFADRCGRPVHVAMDEFQDIAELDKGKAEALLRQHLQTHKAGYLFAGSRRRILRAIFTEKDRPFYNSSILMELAPLPEAALAEYIRERFREGGKRISERSAALVCRLSRGYAYYAQLLAYLLFNGRSAPDAEDVRRAYDRMLDNERYAYRGIVDGLTSVQQSVLIGIAREPGARVTSREFLSRRGLTPGGVQKAVRHLSLQDHIVRDGEGWSAVDPVFADWLDRTF